jgi:hypothetical protein
MYPFQIHQETDLLIFEGRRAIFTENGLVKSIEQIHLTATMEVQEHLTRP